MSTLLDLDDLRGWADRALAARAAAATQVHDDRRRRRSNASSSRSTARQAAPLVAQLHERAEQVRVSEIDRFSRRLAGARRRRARRGRRAHPGDRRQAAARAVGASAPRRRHAPGRAQRRGGQRALRAVTVASAPCAWPPAAAPRRRRRPVSSLTPIAGGHRPARPSWCSSRPPATATQAAPLHTIGGLGVFVKEVQHAVLDGRADVAVHSAKDLPSETPAGLVIGAFCARRDPADALVGAALDRARARARRWRRGSVRRRAQLATVRPDLTFVELRGNIARRLDQVPARRSGRDGGRRARRARAHRPRRRAARP